MKRDRLTIQLTTPLVILIVGFGFSLAANLMWTCRDWAPGWEIRMLGGALASLALPGCIHAWPQIKLPPAPRLPVWKSKSIPIPALRIIRAFVMTGVACMAAYTTFSHASALLVKAGEDPMLAALYPIMTECLVVFGVLAHKTPAAERTADRTRTGPVPTGPQAQPTRPALTVPAEPPKPKPALEPTGRRKKTPVEPYARANWPVTGPELIKQTGCAPGSAYRVVAKLKAEQNGQLEPVS